jgi:hypothetical protein
MSQFTPQEYAPLYVSINDEYQDQIQSITLDQMSNASDVETIMREWAGVVKGAARTECTLKGVVAYSNTDGGGVGFDAGGSTAGGTAIASTMVTSLNQNANQPIKFIIEIGSPQVQKYMFKGFVKDVSVDYSIGKVVEVTYKATGQFSLFE